MSTESIVLGRGISVEGSASKEESGTFRRQVISLLADLFFLVPAALFWQGFIADVKQWADSGETSRFTKSDRPGFVVDKQTGGLWPLRVIQALSRESESD